MRIEPSLQAAFVDYGGNRHGFLAFGEIHPDYYHVDDKTMAELEKEVKDFVEYKLSAYKVANPTKRSDLLPKSIYTFDIPNEIARVKRYKEYAEYCLKQLEQMQKEG